MQIELAPYSGKKICVAVSGGRDSMALLHYMLTSAAEYNIELCALNCDHGIRGEASARDSAFVCEYCRTNGILCYKYSAEGFESEEAARLWRLSCYADVIDSRKADFIATAHHVTDNAETVIFNLARGSSLAGMCGICDDYSLKLIRPMIACTREEIDGYVARNSIPYVTDESNLTDAYTRNYIRHNVIPAIEKAVPGAVKNIYRFSRLAAEDEEYFSREVDKILKKRPQGGYLIGTCTEPVIFKRAVRRILTEYGKKDFTSAQLRTVYEMQWLSAGKKFSFLGLTAVREEGGVAVAPNSADGECRAPFGEITGAGLFCGQLAKVVEGSYAQSENEKALKFDMDKIPADAVVRFKQNGDRFTKFGGGTKSLGDYLTDKKVPQSLRDKLPLVCSGSDVLIIGGVEISDKVKIDNNTQRAACFVCNSYKS